MIDRLRQLSEARFEAVGQNKKKSQFNFFSLRRAKIAHNFGLSECKRVNKRFSCLMDDKKRTNQNLVCMKEHRIYLAVRQGFLFPYIVPQIRKSVMQNLAIRKVFLIQHSLQTLDPYYKTDLEFQGCFGGKKLSPKLKNYCNSCHWHRFEYRYIL